VEGSRVQVGPSSGPTEVGPSSGPTEVGPYSGPTEVGPYSGPTETTQEPKKGAAQMMHKPRAGVSVEGEGIAVEERGLPGSELSYLSLVYQGRGFLLK